MKTTRRDFIRILAVGSGGLAMHNPILNWMTGDDDFADNSFDESKAHRYPTYCEICFWQCAGWTYTTQEGKIWKVVGHEEDQHSLGRFCPRGTGGIGSYYDEDRLRNPLIREGEPGNQRFRDASWDEALDLIADKLKEVAAKHGPECIALFTHGSGGKFWGHTLKAFGSPSITAPSFAQCRGPREVGFQTTFGQGIGSPEPVDIRDSKCIVFIGSHYGENMHNGPVQEMAQAIDKGATIITVDPRFSTAASKSKYWLPIKPATDIALLLAWTNVIIEEELYDKEFVENHTYGFDQLKAHVKDKTPEWASGITTLDPNLIRESARTMGKAAPAAVIHPGRHTTWYGDDTQRSRAIAILNAILGAWGRSGGFYMPDKKSIPDFPHPPYPKPSKTWRDAFPGQYNLAKETLSSGICDATIISAERDCNFKAWIVNGTNLMSTLPNQKNTLQAIQDLEFLVAIDTMPSEITSYADVVLPECTYLERYDMLRSSKHRKPSVALRMPAAKPKYDSKPGWWMAKEIAERLGLADYYKDPNPADTTYDTWIEKVLDFQLKEIGTSLKEMQQIGVKNYDRKYNDLYIADGQELNFFTNTGKVELYSTAMLNEGFDPLPNYKHHDEPPEGYYRLNYGRAPMHTFTRTINNPFLNALKSENKLWVNPKVAKEWGLKNEQKVWLQNQDGVVSSFPIKVRVTERIRHDSVFMPHGFGQYNKKLTRAYGRGIDDNELITKVLYDPVMGGTGMRGNFVTFLTEAPRKEVKS